jgi:ribosomal-protein-alanine N-acetyltransferase
MIKDEIKNIILLIESVNSRIGNTDEYVDKISNHSTILPFIEEGRLQGFISYYNNDPDKENAFLTLIAIHPDFQGKGLGKKLLSFSIADLEQKKFKNYSLEVLKDNTIAIALYESFGFKIKEDRDLVWLMNLEL